MQKVDQYKWKVIATGEFMTLEKEESPELTCTAGSKTHNWELLRFRNLCLKWTDCCVDSAVVYYCECPLEYMHTLELITDADEKGEGGNSVSIEIDDKNMKDPSKNYRELHLENFQPWFDALLGAMGVEKTFEQWVKICKENQISSFFPDV